MKLKGSNNLGDLGISGNGVKIRLKEMQSDGAESILLDQNRVQWRDFVNKTINLRFL
jgi:hypothetical protein